MKNDPTLRQKVASMVAPADHATAPSTIEVDAEGFEFAVIIVQCGVMDDSETVDIQVQTSASSGSGMADVTGALFELTTADDNTAFFGVVRLDGAERYLDLNITQTGANSAAYSVTCLLTNAQYGKQAAADDPVFAV